MKLKWMLGEVKFFDYWTGQGLIKGESGKYYQVHYSTIESKKKWKSLKPNQKVEFLPLEFSDQNIVKKLKEV